MPPPRRAKPARKSARFRVADGSPRPCPLHPEPVGSGPRPHAPKDGRSGVGERPSPDAPRPGKRRPTPGSLLPAPQRAKPARKSARCGGSDGSQRPRPTQPQPVGTGPWPHAPKDGRSGVGEHPTPDAPHTGERRPPPPGRTRAAPTARKSARCGVGDGSPRPQPPHPQPVGSGPRPHAPKDGRLGVGERPTPDAPHTDQRRLPRGALVPPPQCAKPARKSAGCGVGDGSPRPHPPHPQPVGSGPRPHAPKDARSGLGERPTPDAPRTGKRRASRAPSCRPHSAQSQLARPRAFGLLTGPHARAHCTHSQWVVGPGRTPQRSAGREWGSARVRTPQTRARGAPPRAPLCRPHSAQSQLARVRAVGVVTGPNSRVHGTHSQWVLGPGRTPQRTGGRGWDSAQPRTPHAQARGAPPGSPHAAPTARKASSQEHALSGC